MVTVALECIALRPLEREHRDREACRVAAGGYRLTAEVGQSLGEVSQKDINGYLAIAVAHSACSPLGRRTAEQDRWMGLLHGLRVRDNALKGNELPSVRCFFLGPDRLHRLDAFAQHLPAPLERHAMMFHFLAIPPAANAVQDAAM